MSRKLKVFVLILSFLFLGWFIFQPLSRLGISHPYSEAPQAGQTIDAAELNEFLNLWSRMLHSSLRQQITQISLYSGKQYPQDISNWLNNHNWNVERFFYDEQRLHELVDCVNLQENLKSNEILSRKGQKNLSAIIADQRKRLNMCNKYSPDEMELIKANLYQITEIFAGRAIMDKTSD